MTSAWALALEKRAEIAPSLRRHFWSPVRRLLKMFHILPALTAAAVCGLLAIDGQLKEIYLSYMEDFASAGAVATFIRLAAAAIGFGLISAVLYEAHYRLSGPRISVIYSMNSEVGTGSRLRSVQDITATVIALSPWLGLIAGLLYANASLNGLLKTLHDANVDKAGPTAMQQLVHVPTPSAWAIAGAFLVLGASAARLAALDRKNRPLQASVMALTPPAAALLFLMLIGMPALSATPFAIGAMGAAVLAAVGYWIVYYRIQKMRAYIFRVTALQTDDNFSVLQWQRIIMFGWALLPWLLGLAVYFALPLIIGLESQPSGASSSDASATAYPSLAMIPVALCWVIAIGLWVASLLHHVRDSLALKVSLYVFIGIVGALKLLLFWHAQTDTIVTVARVVGPLGSLAISLVMLVAVFVLFAVLSQRSSFPALTLSILVILLSAVLPMSPGWSTAWIAALCFIVAVVAILSRLLPAAAVAVILIAIVWINYHKGKESAFNLFQQTHGADLTQQFNSWLTIRGVPVSAGNTEGLLLDSCYATPTQTTSTGPKYPVFIIGVEGGGIYAASAASTFLARLQDENPCFSDHVFAISAVSGGSIGASIFQAIEEARLSKALAAGGPPAKLADIAKTANAATAPGDDASEICRPPAPTAKEPVTSVSFEREVCDIVQGDDFSPLVASIFPELLGFTSKGRAVELAASFQQSTNREDPGAGAILSAPFANEWSVSTKAPALVLNATWVETGFRTAFAPFPLHKIDDSLYSFFDENMPITPSQTLMGAAVVSARFPFVLPPYSVEVTPPKEASKDGKAASSDPPVRWNFVDGGYSDSSGAATALALYSALSGIARSRNVALQLILLTSSDPKLEPNQITGTAFADIMGPANAMLSVRGGLANEAVARACDGVGAAARASDGSGTAPNTCEGLANKGGAPLQIVGIEDQTYGLSLGWKISQTTFSVVSWMLGQPSEVTDADCNGSTTAAGANAQSNGQFVLNEKVVIRNSCVLRSIQQALGNGSTNGTAPNAGATAH